jgi:flagellar biosynthesis chaperone FliJ
LIGLAILSSRSKTIQRFLKYLEDRFPHHHERVEKWRERVRNWFKTG